MVCWNFLELPLEFIVAIIVKPNIAKVLQAHKFRWNLNNENYERYKGKKKQQRDIFHDFSYVFMFNSFKTPSEKSFHYNTIYSNLWSFFFFIVASAPYNGL